MVIKKGNKTFSVTEQKTQWKVSTKSGAITIEYNIPKAECQTIGDLEKYIAADALF